MISYLCGLTSAVDEAISRVAHIANAEVTPKSVVTVRIRLAHRQVETTLINVCIDNSIIQISHKACDYIITITSNAIFIQCKAHRAITQETSRCVDTAMITSISVQCTLINIWNEYHSIKWQLVATVSSYHCTENHFQNNLHYKYR